MFWRDEKLISGRPQGAAPTNHNHTVHDTKIKSILLLTFLTTFFVSPSSFAKGSIKLTSNITLENRSFVFSRSDHSINDQPAIETDFSFIFDNQKNFILHLTPRLHYDALDSDLLRYIPNEAYLKFYNDHWELNAGLQIVSWGVAHSFNPTNVLNRRDMALNYYDPPLLGDPMVGIKWSSANVGLFSQLSFEAYVLPLFLETPLPCDESRFAITSNTGGLTFTKSNFQETPDYTKSVGAGFKASATIKSTDIALVFYHGPERTPAFYLFLDNTLNLKAQPFYYTIDMAGLDFTTVLGPITLRTEAAFKSTYFNDAKRHQIPLVDTSDAIPNSYAQFVGGIDYTIDGIFSHGTLILIAEYIGENNHSTVFEEFRPLKNDVFVGLDLLLNDVRSTELKAGIIKDLNNSEMIVKLEGSTKIYKELKLSLGGMIINQDKDPNMPLSFFDNNTSVYTSLSYSFGKSF